MDSQDFLADLEAIEVVDADKIVSVRPTMWIFRRVDLPHHPSFRLLQLRQDNFSPKGPNADGTKGDTKMRNF